MKNTILSVNEGAQWDTMTENQIDAINKAVTGIFEKKFTSDFWHFSFSGLCFSWDRPENKNDIALFEVHSEMGSFQVQVEVKNGKALKRTFKAVEN